MYSSFGNIDWLIYAKLLTYATTEYQKFILISLLILSEKSSSTGNLPNLWWQIQVFKILSFAWQLELYHRKLILLDVLLVLRDKLTWFFEKLSSKYSGLYNNSLYAKLSLKSKRRSIIKGAGSACSSIT